MSVFITTDQKEYLVMPYGLAKSPSVFQAFMNYVLADMPHYFVIAYIDDILIFSTSPEQHVHHVKQVLGSGGW